MSETNNNPGPIEVTNKSKGIYAAFMFLGVIAFGMTVIKDPSRAWHAYLVGFFYFMTLSLGGFFFTALQHVAKAGWSVNIRRFSESLMAFLPYGFGLGIVFLYGSFELYDWLKPEVVANDHLLQHKAGYLNKTFFFIRFITFFVAWIVLAKMMIGNSLKQDKTGDVNLTHKNVTVGVVSILIFAITYSFFSVDTVMALEAHWFSTMFGVYAFSGMFQSTMALMILIILRQVENGKLKGRVDMNHIHDLGKFLFGFTVFWAYIAFSQYMLIWYANLPEETFFFLPRSTGSWMLVSISLILCKFIVPFFALLPRWAKRNTAHLKAVSYWVLIFQFVDIFWVVYPHYSEEHVALGLPEVLIFLGFAGVFMWSITQFLGKHPMTPLKDPRQHESDHHHVVY